MIGSFFISLSLIKGAYQFRKWRIFVVVRYYCEIGSFLTFLFRMIETTTSTQ